MSPSGIEIVRLEADDSPDFGFVTSLAEAEGHRFVARAAEEWNDGSNRFDQKGEGFFVARREGQIIGTAGLQEDPYLTDPSVGRVRRVYVAPETRRLGVGRAMVSGCIELARGRFVRLRLGTDNSEAARLYEALGFSPVDEPKASHALELRPG